MRCFLNATNLTINLKGWILNTRIKKIIPFVIGFISKPYATRHKSMTLRDTFRLKSKFKLFKSNSTKLTDLLQNPVKLP
jgi:hypothetical protein